MRAALCAAAYTLAAIGLSGLVAAAAAVSHYRRADEPDDFALWAVELFGAAALSGEVSG